MALPEALFISFCTSFKEMKAGVAIKVVSQVTIGKGVGDSLSSLFLTIAKGQWGGQETGTEVQMQQHEQDLLERWGDQGILSFRMLVAE